MALFDIFDIFDVISCPYLSGSGGPSFWAITPGSGNELKGVYKGTGELTEACTSTRYQPDHEGIYRPFGSAEPAYKSGRVVTNGFKHSSDLSTAVWLYGGAGKAGDATDELLSTPSGILYVRQGFPVDYIKAEDNIIVAWEVQVPAGQGATEVGVRLQLSTWVDSPYVSIPEDGQWHTISFPLTAPAGVAPSASSVVIWTKNADESQLHARNAQIEVSTSRSDTATPSEYIPTTSTPVTKIFTTENGNSVTDNIVTEAPGAALAELPWLYCGPGATNSAIHSNDATNAAWVKTNITPTFDADGIDGVPNNGSTLLATAANATIYQTITAVSGEHTAKFYLRRKTGTGTIEITVDGGTTWAGVTLTSAYQEFSVDKAELTNPQIGIRIVTSADAVEMGNGECYLTSSIAEVRGTSPIFTTGAPISVNATDLSFDDVNHPLEGGYFIEWQPQYSTSEVSGDIEIISLDNNAGVLYYDATNSLLESTDGTNTASVALTIVAGTTYKIWVAYGGTDLQVGVDATLGGLATYDGAFASGTKIEVCTPSANVNLVRNLQTHEGSFTEAVAALQELAA